MRIAFVTSQVPNTEYSASTYCALLLLEGLAAAGHEVAVILPLERDSRAVDAATRQRWLSELSARGFDARPIAGDPPRRSHAFRGVGRLARFQRLIHPRVEDYFPHTGLGQILRTAVGDVDPDALLLLSYEAVAATDAIHDVPRMAFLGEPPHFPLSYRMGPPFVARPARFPRRSLDALDLRRRSEATVRLLDRCDGIALNAAHHVDWLRRQGVTHAKYLRYPAPDWGGSDWRARRRSAATGPFRILLIGRVTGSSTLPGLYLLADEVLPALDRVLGDGFEIHVCGGGRLPDDLERRLRRPAVRLRGFVDDIAAEVLDADVFLVPTPLELGTRTRISYAWSCGSRVVSHSANSLGLRELEHEHNALLAADGQGLAEAIARLRHDPDLADRLGTGGRETYDSLFAPRVATAAVVEELERLANARSIATAAA